MRIHDAYTKAINLVKRAAGLLIILMLVLVFIVPAFYTKSERLDLAMHAKKEDYTSDDDKVMSPRILGKNDKNQLYSIIAEYGIKNGQNIIKMSKITAKMLLDEGKELRIKSDRGKSDTTSSMIDLEAGVVITLSTGEKLFTDLLQVDYKKSSVWTESGVRLFSGKDCLSAQKMFITAGGDEMHFLGNVKVRIEQ